MASSECFTKLANFKLVLPIVGLAIRQNVRQYFQAIIFYEKEGLIYIRTFILSKAALPFTNSHNLPATIAYTNGTPSLNNSSKHF